MINELGKSLYNGSMQSFINNVNEYCIKNPEMGVDKMRLILSMLENRDYIAVLDEIYEWESQNVL